MDPTTELIAQNVREARLKKGLSLMSVEILSEETGYRIPSTVLRRIESCDRHLTVKDLLVLAVVLETSPLDLMLPMPCSGEAEVTGIGKIDADEAWGWASGSIRY